MDFVKYSPRMVYFVFQPIINHIIPILPYNRFIIGYITKVKFYFIGCYTDWFNI